MESDTVDVLMCQHVHIPRASVQFFSSSFCARPAPQRQFCCACSTVERVCGGRRIACHICTSAEDSTWVDDNAGAHRQVLGAYCAAPLDFGYVLLSTEERDQSWFRARDLAISTFNSLQPRPHDACTVVCIRVSDRFVHITSIFRRQSS